jgi:hypothetical protein
VCSAVMRGGLDSGSPVLPSHPQPRATASGRLWALPHPIDTPYTSAHHIGTAHSPRSYMTHVTPASKSGSGCFGACMLSHTGYWRALRSTAPCAFAPGVPSCKSSPLELEGLLVAPPIKRQLPHLLCAKSKKNYKRLVRRGGREARNKHKHVVQVLVLVAVKRVRNSRLYIWESPDVDVEP